MNEGGRVKSPNKSTSLARQACLTSFQAGVAEAGVADAVEVISCKEIGRGELLALNFYNGKQHNLDAITNCSLASPPYGAAGATGIAPMQEKLPE